MVAKRPWTATLLKCYHDSCTYLYCPFSLLEHKINGYLVWIWAQIVKSGYTGLMISVSVFKYLIVPFFQITEECRVFWLYENVHFLAIIKRVLPLLSLMSISILDCKRSNVIWQLHWGQLCMHNAISYFYVGYFWSKSLISQEKMSG